MVGQCEDLQQVITQEKFNGLHDIVRLRRHDNVLVTTFLVGLTTLWQS